MAVTPCPRCTTLIPSDKSCPNCRQPTAPGAGAVALLGLLIAGCGPSDPQAPTEPEATPEVRADPEPPIELRAIYGPPRDMEREKLVIEPPEVIEPPSLDADGDGDGHEAPADCDDSDAAVHPDASDVTKDGVDQNCDGIDGKPMPAKPEAPPENIEVQAIYGIPRTEVEVIEK